jgi:hypothetical protein
VAFDNQGLLFVGCLIVFAVYVALVARRGTVLWGLNVLNVFMIASATLPGFFFGTLFDLLPDTFTDEHLVVVAYSILGLTAMVAGIYLAWLPIGRTNNPQNGQIGLVPTHINEGLGWLTFWTGASAELMLRFVSTVPTLSTGVHCLASLAKIGLCILLTVAIKERRWSRFLVALTTFQMLSIVGSLASGFSFIRFQALLPLVAIWFVSRGLDFRNLIRWSLLAPVCGLAMFVISAAWLQTRDVIREGRLEGMTLIEEAGEFFRIYGSNLTSPDAKSFMAAIMFRVDMTDILAAQVRYQPSVEPYAQGETLLPILYAVIPRVLWSDKPVIVGGNSFVARFTGLHWDSATSVGLPYPFELYANGGPLLVIFGLGAIGFVCGKLELRLLRPQKSLGGFWALALVTAVLTEGGERTDTVVPALVASALAAYALGMVVEKLRGDLWPRAAPFILNRHASVH